MAVFKCKMCGGTLEIEGAKSIAVCEYCGTKQTVPKADNEKKLTLFGRANRLRLGCEFDKAAGVYETIVADFPEEAEAYWGLLLCKYGIEYVDDPATGKKVPTCHRSSFDSVLEDSDFEQALENADVEARALYREEAKAIEILRKDILAVSNNEQPYDIFICYKETDENGDRTVDSVIAQDTYDALTEKGYRVFFSRISLEDKLGKEYEPYIFAALHSAKVMLAFGTDYEYYNAVWVKNEWGRFLKLMEKDHHKVLIPCYKGIDAYDMPKEFAKLQAQDMGKVGATQDLLRGIEKILGSKKENKDTVIVQQSGLEAKSFIDRASAFLKEEDWSRADLFCEQALMLDAECAEAYLGKLMADLHVREREDLSTYIEPFEQNKNYEKAMQIAGPELQAELKGANRCIRERIQKEEEQRRLEQEQLAEILRQAQEKRKAKVKKVTGIASAILAICLVITFLIQNFIIPYRHYKKAEQFEKSGKILQAALYYGQAKSFMDAKERHGKILEQIGARNTISTGEYHTVGLKADGTVVAVGDKSNGQCNVDTWSNMVAISVGTSHTVGLKATGKVLAVGHNFFGQCNVNTWSHIVAIYAGSNHTVGLKADGTVVTTGNNAHKQCQVADWNNIVSISAGDAHTVGLKADGTVLAVGYNKYNQCEVSSWADIISIHTGWRHTVGLKADGTVIATGYNADGRCDVSSWTDIVAISAGQSHTVGLKADGTVVAVGDHGGGRCDVDDWTDIVAISAGNEHTVGLKADGTVVIVGNNARGRCNVDGWSDIKVPETNR